MKVPCPNSFDVSPPAIENEFNLLDPKHGTVWPTLSIEHGFARYNQNRLFDFSQICPKLITPIPGCKFYSTISLHHASSGFPNYANSLFARSKSTSLWSLACFPQTHAIFLFSTLTVFCVYIWMLLTLSHFICFYLLLDGSFPEDKLSSCNCFLKNHSYNLLKYFEYK